MKFFKTLCLSLLLSLTGLNATQAQTNSKSAETPAKTICIKHPMANDVDRFFSNNSAIMFEVYKPGDMVNIMELLKKDSNVKECQAGTVTGDYHQLTLVVKVQKDKAYYAALFKKAGLTTIKINNNPIVAVDKM
jgi:hypothetical protein